MVSNNQKQSINEILSNLSEDEQKVALEIFKQYADTGQSELFEEIKYADFDEIPVDINTFMHDPKYLGKALINAEGKFTVFPYWEEKLKEIFPDNMRTNYNTVIFTGSIGIGKSTIAVIIMLYLLYRMLCLNDPYLYYGLQPIDKISFSFMNLSLDAARGVAMDKFHQMILASPWFLDHGEVAGTVHLEYRPNKHIECIAGSNNNHVIGRAIFCLDGDTVIKTTTGDYSLKELENKEIKVPTLSPLGEQIISDGCTVMPTIKTNEEFEIELVDGTVIKCTPKHKLLLMDGTYKEAQYLVESDEIQEAYPETYESFINNIINTRGQWNIPVDTYFEGHHIIPKCFGGTGRSKSKDKNIIWLLPEEHYKAHKLLALENPKNAKLVYAWSMMAFPKGKTKRTKIYSAEDYALLRKMQSDVLKMNNPGLNEEGHPWNYKKVGSCSEETRKKISLAKKGRQLGPRKNKKPPKLRPKESQIDKHTRLSKQTSGINNPMYKKGYRISGGKNGHAIYNYIFENIVYDCRDALMKRLKSIYTTISESTIRCLMKNPTSKRILKKYPLLINLRWELKK